MQKLYGMVTNLDVGSFLGWDSVPRLAVWFNNEQEKWFEERGFGSGAAYMVWGTTIAFKSLSDQDELCV
jgi:hypothetical protein